MTEGPGAAAPDEQPVAASGDVATFDPWTATVEQSLELPLELDDARSRIWQFIAAQNLKRRRAKIEAGADSVGVLAAVATCVRHGLVVPAWLGDRFVGAVDRVRHLEVDSWDLAFGRPYPGVHVGQRAQQEWNRLKLVALIDAYRRDNPEGPLDPQWDGWAQRIGVSRRQAERLYAQARKLGEVHARSKGDSGGD